MASVGQYNGDSQPQGRVAAGCDDDKEWRPKARTENYHSNQRLWRRQGTCKLVRAFKFLLTLVASEGPLYSRHGPPKLSHVPEHSGLWRLYSHALPSSRVL